MVRAKDGAGHTKLLVAGAALCLGAVGLSWYYSSYRNNFLTGKRLFDEGRYDKAAQAFERAATASADDTQTLAFLALSYGNLKRFAEVETVLRRLRAAEPYLEAAGEKDKRFVVKAYLVVASQYAMEAADKKDVTMLARARNIAEHAWKLDPSVFSEKEKKFLDSLQDSSVP